MSKEANHKYSKLINLPEGTSELYPNNAFTFSHHLSDDPLLSVNALIEAAEELPPSMIECVSYQAGTPLIDIIKNIKTSSSWLIFRNLEQLSRYEKLMNTIIQALINGGLMKKGDFHDLMCFAFLSSPLVKTPFHIDPEHNFLIQIKGTKIVRINNHQQKPIISNREISDFYKDEVGYILNFDERYDKRLESFFLNSSTGVYIPVAYPHLVNNGTEMSVSFSVTFRTDMSEKHRLKYLTDNGSSTH
jgi:hypothetical protein